MQDEFHTKINAEFQLGNITETVNNTHKSREKIGQYLRKRKKKIVNSGELCIPAKKRLKRLSSLTI